MQMEKDRRHFQKDIEAKSSSTLDADVSNFEILNSPNGSFSQALIPQFSARERDQENRTPSPQHKKSRSQSVRYVSQSSSTKLLASETHNLMRQITEKEEDDHNDAKDSRKDSMSQSTSQLYKSPPLKFSANSPDSRMITSQMVSSQYIPDNRTQGEKMNKQFTRSASLILVLNDYLSLPARLLLPTRNLLKFDRFLLLHL